MYRILLGILGLGGDPGVDPENAAPIEGSRRVDLHHRFGCGLRERRDARAGAVSGAIIPAQRSLS